MKAALQGGPGYLCQLLSGRAWRYLIHEGSLDQAGAGMCGFMGWGGVIVHEKNELEEYGIAQIFIDDGRIGT